VGLRLLAMLLLSIAVLLGSCARRSAIDVRSATPEEAPSAAPEPRDELPGPGAMEAPALAELRSAGELSRAGDPDGAAREWGKKLRLNQHVCELLYRDGTNLAAK
jgi:hypothetical protein